MYYLLNPLNLVCSFYLPLIRWFCLLSPFNMCYVLPPLYLVYQFSQ